MPRANWIARGIIAQSLCLKHTHSHACECMHTEFIIVIGPAGLTSNPRKALQLGRWVSIGWFVLSQPEPHQWWIPRSADEGRMNTWTPSFLTQTTNTLTKVGYKLLNVQPDFIHGSPAERGTDDTDVQMFCDSVKVGTRVETSKYRWPDGVRY